MLRTSSGLQGFRYLLSLELFLPPQVRCQFSLAAFKSFVFSFQKFHYNVSWHGFLWVYPAWGLLSFLNLRVYIFCEVKDVSGAAAAPVEAVGQATRRSEQTPR